MITRSLPLIRQTVAAVPSPADSVRSSRVRRRVLIESVIAAICA